MHLLTLALSALIFGGEGPDPSNQFDWTIPSGEVFVFNTTSQQIVSSPPHSRQTVLGGFVSVRDFTIEDGGVLIVEGPNPLVLCAGGRVLIDGRLSIDGSNNHGVLAVNTTSIPELGALGQGGGGRGGTGSPFSGSSSAAGGHGFGAFGVPDAGGQGGETGWSQTPKVDERRGAGGGGGVLGADQQSLSPGNGFFDQSAIGLDAEPGFDNTEPWSTGALSGLNGVVGGARGVGPFIDSNPRNDFFGTMVLPGGRVIHGELKQPWAGAGGGGGGDANRPKGSSTFPGQWWKAGDEKGAGGGGGAGSLRILALGPIVFGPFGEVTANGGTGGGGEHTLFLNRVGGGSGGGSGGHIILETADHIDLSQILSNSKILRALGGQGGAGKDNEGGAAPFTWQALQTDPGYDACPSGYPYSCFVGHVDGAGGDGGPGIIQLHTPRGLRDIALPPGKSLDDIAKPRPLCWDGGCRMLVSFGPGGTPVPARASTTELWRPEGWSLESLKMSSSR